MNNEMPAVRGVLLQLHLPHLRQGWLSPLFLGLTALWKGLCGSGLGDGSSSGKKG